jgi:hypothetical protein
VNVDTDPALTINADSDHADPDPGYTLKKHFSKSKNNVK